MASKIFANGVLLGNLLWLKLDLSQCQQMVLLAVAMRMDARKGLTSYQSIADIMDFAKCKKTACIEALNVLESEKIIDKIHRPNNTTVYTLNERIIILIKELRKNETTNTSTSTSKRNEAEQAF